MVRSLSVTLVLVAACGGGGGFIDAGATGGVMTFSWKLVDMNQTLLTCSQVSADNVNVTIMDLSNGGSMIETFPCNDASDLSLMLLDGTYSASFSLATNGSVLSTGTTTSGIVIGGGINVAVSTSFSIDALGGMDLLLVSGAKNCTAAPAGAGITSMTITMQHNDTGPCDNAIFAISAGATQPAGNYTVNCAAPVAAPCIENDQHLTVSGLTSGRYSLHVAGDIGATSCWTTVSSVQVPAAEQVTMQTLQLVDSGAPGC